MDFPASAEPQIGSEIGSVPSAAQDSLYLHKKASSPEPLRTEQPKCNSALVTR